MSAELDFKDNEVSKEGDMTSIFKLLVEVAIRNINGVSQISVERTGDFPISF